jgi:quinol monooxygenase YgiN
MIIVHSTFVCKPGNAGKMAKLFKENIPSNETGKGGGVYIMTDMTGQFHRVVMVSTYESLAAFDEEMKKMGADTPENKKMGEAMKGMNDMYISGSREIFKVW